MVDRISPSTNARNLRVLILGGDGMLGHKVFQTLHDRFDTYATFRNSSGLWRRFPMYEGHNSDHLLGGVDAANVDSVVRTFAAVRPHVAINCIGIIKQLKEARDPVLSITVNSLFPHRLADLCAATGTRMLHVSTDCVFSGRKGNYSEDEPSDAEDLYGQSKHLGEVDRPGCLTIRTSIFGRDFLKSSALLEWFLGQRGKRVRGYKHAIFSGFPTANLARVIGDVIADHPDLSGLYHVASTPISKYELLSRIRDAMDLPIEIEPFDDRPCNRALNADRFTNATRYQIPSWDAMIGELARDATPYDQWRQHYATA